MSTSVDVHSAIRAANGRSIHQGRNTVIFSIQRTAIALALDHSRDIKSWAIIEALFQKYPEAFFWAVRASILDELGPPQLLANDAGMWKIAQIEALRSLPTLELGGWAIFFYQPGHAPPKVPHELVSEGLGLETLVSAMAAEAVVVSWYDDSEWLVAAKM